MFQLDVSRIKNIPGEARRLVGEARMDPVGGAAGQLFFDSPLKLDLLIYNEDGLLKLSGFLEGEVKTACGRCLEMVSLPVRAQLHETYYNESQPGLNPGEDWIPFRGDRLDITPEVIKSTLHSLPMKILCGDNCRGLCPGCGANLNISECVCSREDVDPRLEALKKLFGKQ